MEASGDAQKNSKTLKNNVTTNPLIDRDKQKELPSKR